MHRQDAPRGRGAAADPPNRFEAIHFEPDPTDLVPDPDDPDAERRGPRTVYLRDASRSIISTNKSPDVPFEASLNPYRGREHGCSYCYARPTHEYLGFSAGLDFETKIVVKQDAPDLLRRALASPRWEPKVLAMSGVTDPYQPVERRLGITRRCVEVLRDFRNPVAVVTKNHLVTRDADLFAELARHDAAAVFVSITTLDPALAGALEPRTSRPARRLLAIEALAAAGVPVGVMVAPVIPGLNDHEIPAILAAAAAAGARHAGKVVLRLPGAVRDIFADWLERHAPSKKQKVLGRVRAVRGGRENDPRFGSRMRGEGIFADQIDQLFALGCRKAGLGGDERVGLSTAAFRRLPADGQLPLFEV